MEAFLISAGVVAASEIGDKTQLLAIVLAARFRRPVPIIAGILLATVANHTLAAWLGVLVADWLGPVWMRWVLGLSFLAMAAWALVPDTESGTGEAVGRFGAFVATLIAFFLVEIGDKTQIATVALAARFHNVALVTLGTTTGMMIADVPAVALGEIAATRLPLRLMRTVTAAIFAVLGIAALLDVGRLFG